MIKHITKMYSAVYPLEFIVIFLETIMRTPGIVTLKNVIEGANSNHAEINGRWVPARPIGYYSCRYRLKAAWLVFTGKCDALKWPEGQ